MSEEAERQIIDLLVEIKDEIAHLRVECRAAADALHEVIARPDKREANR